MESKLGDAMAGTADRPYKLVIVGGGPAGYSILIRAMRINVMDQLCRSSDSGQNGSEGGVCLMDSGKEYRLGGGRLQDYSISSNTWGNKFYENVVEEKEDSLPAESIQETTLQGLTNEGGAYFSAAGKKLDEGGASEAPLKTVGKFLVDVASSVHKALLAYPQSSSIKSECKVISVERVKRLLPVQQADALAAKDSKGSDTKDAKDGDSSSSAEGTEAEQCRSMWKVVFANEQTSETSEVYCTKVAFATGGKQAAPDLASKSLNAKLLCSDNVCTDPGIADLRKLLLRSGGSLEKKRIVIVGGSHSAFSAAWMCLNQLGLSKEQTQKHGVLGNSSIILLHRSPVRVFYGTKREADQDGYEDIGIVNKTTGQIHPFGGLRGDSKQLWRDIRAGREPRVRLVKAAGANFKAKLYDEAAVIVWACGYETNSVPVLDACSKPLELCTEQGQTAVDDAARLSTIEYLPGVSMGTGPASAPATTAASKSKGMDKDKEEAAVDTAAAKSGGGDEGGSGAPLSPGKSSGKASSTPSRGGSGGDEERESKEQKGGPSSPVPLKDRDRDTSVSPVRTSRDRDKDKDKDMAGTRAAAPASFPVQGLLGLGLGYGLKATLNSSAVLDGSSGRADGVAVYLKRAATLVLADVLGTQVYGLRPPGFYSTGTGTTGGTCSGNGAPLSHMSAIAAGQGYIDSWDERAAILNETKRRAQRAEREAKEEEGRQAREQEREREREREPRREAKAAGREDKDSGGGGGGARTPARKAAGPLTPAPAPAPSESKPLRFPSISSKESAEEDTITASTSLCASASADKGRDRDRDRDRTDRDAKASFCATSGGAGALSLATAYTMSSEFQKKLNRALDPGRVSSCVDRLSKPRALQIYGSGSGSGSGSGGEIPDINSSGSSGAGAGGGSASGKKVVVKRRKTITAGAGAPGSGEAGGKSGSGGTGVKLAWHEAKEGGGAGGVDAHSGTATTTTTIATASKSGNEEQKSSSPLPASVGSGRGTESCAVPLSPIKSPSPPSSSSSASSLLYSPLKPSAAHGTGSGARSTDTDTAFRGAKLSSAAGTGRGILSRGPLLITGSGTGRGLAGGQRTAVLAKRL